MRTSIPWLTSSRTPSGVRATRCSSRLISLGTPILAIGETRGAARPEDAMGVVKSCGSTLGPTWP